MLTGSEFHGKRRHSRRPPGFFPLERCLERWLAPFQAAPFQAEDADYSNVADQRDVSAVSKPSMKIELSPAAM